MQRFVLSTADIPQQDRFAYWREQVSESMIGITGEPDPERKEPFTARIEACIGASIARFRHRSDGFPVFRRPREIARRSWEDWVCLYRERGQGAWFKTDGQEFVTRRGDLIIADPAMPFATNAVREYDTELWFVRRALLEPHLPAGRIPRLHPLAHDSGIDRLTRAYLDALGPQLTAMSDAQADSVADNFCRLLGVALGSAPGDQRAALRVARLDEAKRYINNHLSDPDLTPEQTAAALRISVRQLHLLFGPTGTSFAQYVLRRRLEECRASLLNPISPRRSVTDIALGWGFNSLGTFYRTFRRTFGVTPNEIRNAAEERE
jgi:AraC-like DNA-binding protein